MKAYRFPNRWSLLSSLFKVGTVPALLMFSVMAFYQYRSGSQEAVSRVRASGELLATALAESSRYGVVSGSKEELLRTIERMRALNTGVASVQIFDEDRSILVWSGTVPADATFAYERPIVADVPDLDSFDTTGPHTGAALHSDPPKFLTGRPVGSVRVVMSPDTIIGEQKKRLVINFVILGFALSAGLAAVAYLSRPLSGFLRSVAQILRQIKGGDLSAEFPVVYPGEMGEVQAVIQEMARGLRISQGELLNLVDRRTAELQKAVEAARASDAQRRDLIAHSNDLIEDERKKIAQELHDQFNASVLAIRARANILKVNPETLTSQKVGAAAEGILQSVNQLYADTRRLVKRLRPEVIDMLGLGGAITEEVRGFNEEQSGCKVSLIAEQLPHLPHRVAIAAYRAVQEALSNIIKHSQATTAHVRLSWDEDDGLVCVDISDNGVGFDSAAKRSGFGLLGMRERVESVGGTLRVDTSAGGGTRIRIRIPVTSGNGQSTDAAIGDE